jgi:hypothetical protein
VALHEPFVIQKMAGADGDPIEAVHDIVEFLLETRRGLLSEGKAWTKHIDGQVPDNHVFGDWKEGGPLRRMVNTRDYIEFKKRLPQDFHLTVKHNEEFAALLPTLIKTGIRIIAIVRHPLAAMMSWNTIDMKVRTGAAPVARIFDPEMGRTLDGMDDIVDRQMFMLNWYFQRFVDYVPAECILRYEDIVRSGGTLLRHINPGAQSLKLDLASRNSAHGDTEIGRRLARRLENADGPFRKFYPDRVG